MEIRKRKTFPLRLTKFELVHLRDLFSIKLPPELKQTISQGLAAAEDRSLIESALWQKVVAACLDAELPLDDAAPDFVCAGQLTGPISVGVFRLAQEPNEGQHTGEAGSNPFGIEDAEEDEQDEHKCPWCGAVNTKHCCKHSRAHDKRMTEAAKHIKEEE